MTHLASGIDLAALDPSTPPSEDFYRHVNGKWLDSYEIPADRARDGAFRRLHDEAELHVHEIVTSADPGSRIGALYASFMDEDRLNEIGIAPLAAELTALDVPDKRALARAMGALQRAGSSGAIAAFIDTDSDDPTVYAMYLMQSGLGLPDEAYYREDAHAEVRAKYGPHIERMLTLAGWEPAAAHADAKRIIDFETALATHHWDVVKDRDATATHNPMTWAEFTALAPQFDWDGWLATMAPGLTLDRVIVREPSFFTGFGELWEATPLETLTAWLSYHLISARAAVLTPEISRANFDFYGTVITGAPEQRARWKRGVGMVEAALGEEIGAEYVRRHFPPSSAERMDTLVANLIAAYRESIQNLPWMSDATKARALDKLSKFTPKIGHPVKWRDYSSLELAADDLYGNTQRSAIFEHDYHLAKLGGPIDRDEWFMTPQTVNAYYYPGMNEIVFPAAILQPPFFNPDADDAVNYGAIGAIIGHEIGHGFDDQGAKYDGDGRLHDWWEPQDLAAFEERTKALIEQYNAYVPTGLSEEHTVNGALTIGENIGDLGGLGIAIKAYQLSLSGQEAPVIDGFTGMQRLLLGYAQAWQTKSRDAEAIRLLSIDPHSPAEFRCNGIVRNIDAFYEAFDVDETSPWYLPPEQRVSIW